MLKGKEPIPVRLWGIEFELIHAYRLCDAEHQAQIEWFVAAAQRSCRGRIPKNVYPLVLKRHPRR